MAISINWGTKVINVPKADMELIQESPEIRELNINTFRLALKDLEDDENGMHFVKTRNNNPPVTVGGVTLARVVEILAPYTVTFEDGQYAVNLVGANSNVADRANVNQVSVRSANSAGLILMSTGVSPTQDEMRIAIWNAQQSNYQQTGTIGERVSKTLTVTKFLALK